MAYFQFVSTWRLIAPIEAVWDVIVDWRRYPEWWPGVVSAEPVAEEGALLRGSVGRLVWQAPMGYRFTVDLRETLRQRPTDYAALASGDLSGSGRWTLWMEGDITTVRFVWRVHTMQRWANLAARLARPLLIWNHDRLMWQGARGLARRLNAPLLSHEEHADGRADGPPDPAPLLRSPAVP
jgi:hypothetical protein